jgi:hypothetical protein
MLVIIMMTYADGHVEIKRWLDSRTVDAPRNDALMPNNKDILWIQNHALGGKKRHV